jgi:hypothetical protein
MLLGIDVCKAIQTYEVNISASDDSAFTTGGDCEFVLEIVHPMTGCGACLPVSKWRNRVCPESLETSAGSITSDNVQGIGC